MSRPIVLIHGLIGHLDDHRIVEALGDVEVHTPHLIGYGSHRGESTDELTLQDQADLIETYLTDHDLAPAHLVGHSVGGAVAVLVAAHDPSLVSSVTSVEGNFTLVDAFWSAQIADAGATEVELIVAGFRNDPGAWIEGAGVSLTNWSRELAASWLDHQPASTIKAQAAAVVEATSSVAFLAAVKRIVDEGVPVNLIAGERSAAGWDVPAWVRSAAVHDIEIPGAGHFLMADAAEAFGRAILTCTREGEGSAASDRSAEPPGFQPDDDRIVWRLHLASPPEVVYRSLDSDGGRASFWAESAVERDGLIHFEFIDGERYAGRVLRREVPRFWSVDYFGWPVEIVLRPDGSGGTDLELSHIEPEGDARHEVTAGWLNVLLPLKAYVDHGIDLHNHDPERCWDQGFADH